MTGSGANTETSSEIHVSREPSMRALVEQLHEGRNQALQMGRSSRVERQHQTGRLTARERLDLLLDPGSWYEIGLLALPEDRRPDGVGAADVITG